MKNRKLQHKHETPEDRTRRHQTAASRSRPLPNGWIAGIHDRRWQDGPPPALLADYAQLEAQTLDYQELS